MGQNRVFSWLWPKIGLYICCVKKNKTPTVPDIAIQSWIRPELSPVSANKDFEKFSNTIRDVDQVLTGSKLEQFAIDFAVADALRECPEADAAFLSKTARKGIKALRTNVLSMLLNNPSCRKLSTMVYSTPLLADFCRVLEIDGKVKGLSKSEVDRMLDFFAEEDVRLLHQALTEIVGNAGTCAKVGLNEPVDASVGLIDSTCLEADIHFPVDWVLLRDVSRTLLKAIILIRRTGLLWRMPQGPEAFAREMNNLCIEMTHSRRRIDGKKARKKVFRQMKKLLKTIGGHAQRHRDLFERMWEQTEYSEGEKDRIIERMDRMLALLPEVIKQAHERIIGGRQVANADKTLSAYEEDVHVIVRKKAGKEVEFGNTLTICESADGYILDWQLYRESAPSESKQLAASLERQENLEMDKPITAMCADRGFSTAATKRLLAEKEIYDATCPRNPAELKERLGEERFSMLQRRRGSTEARIAILRQKHGGRLRQKGFANRSLAVSWSVLAHNLWLVARLLAQQDEELKAAA